jgi:ubiquinone/menaquinone biosynthesis C-methylase UbiE
LSTGATVVSVDLSNAVDVNYRIHRDNKNLLAVQADLRKLPLAERTFDRVFCFGVLQHTPDVERAFKTLPRYLKSGGHLSIDVYDRCEGWARWIEPLYRTYYWLRPITREMPPDRLYRWVEIYVNAMWPASCRIARLPKLGRILNRMMLIHDYRCRYPLSDEQLKQWAVLDTFDNLAPRYDQRQTLSTIKRWFMECDLANVDVQYGYNGIEGRATKC